ncbi:MAG TPA: SDR family NAD(P)-dependent oxidoreductase [Bacillales bacterium]|nr:SDR family NAD(P)-dependent oxidoreductase [Bacillales bacterium]
MDLAIVTGASRGLGAAVAERFLDQGIGLYTVARKENEHLKNRAEQEKLQYAHFKCDLSSPDQQLEVLDKITESLGQLKDIKNVYVVNNAGVVEPVEAIGKIEPGDLQRLLNLNVLAPMVITNRLVQDYPSLPMFFVNVTSGAANRPVHGWSAYGSSKAALNLYTQTAAEENDTGHAPHTFIAFNPGVMDTEMQGVLRSSEKESFRDVERFRGLKEKGQLRDPDTVAEALFGLIFKGNVENGRIYDVNELL